MARHLHLMSIVAPAAVLLLAALPGCAAEGAKRPANEAQSSSNKSTKQVAKQKVILDTDIGGDIDDAFAVAMALESPELEILGFTTAAGDTLARARIIDRMLAESGHTDIPVAAGPVTTLAPPRPIPGFSITRGIGVQEVYGQGGYPAKSSHPDAVDFILEQIRKFPGQVTLIAVGPLSNVGAVIDKDLATFRKVKRVVIMGGAIEAMDDGRGRTIEPYPEGNIRLDIKAAQKLFQSGVPLYVMPADSTLHLRMDEDRRRALFTHITPLTNSLLILYRLWGGNTPVLFDPMAVGFAMNPELCPMRAMHIVVDDEGMTRSSAAAPNAQVCLKSDTTVFFDYYMNRMVPPSASQGSAASASGE